MPELKVGIPKKELDAIKRALDPKFVTRAQIRAMNRSIITGRKFLSMDIRKEWNVKAGKIKDDNIMKNATRGDPNARIAYAGVKISLINFGARKKKVMSARGPRVGATVKVKKTEGRRLVWGKHGGFIAKGNASNTHIFQRTGKKRHPIELVPGTAVAQMITEERVNRMVPVMGESYAKNFFADLRHFQAKASGKR